VKREIKAPWTLYPFSSCQFKRWRSGYVGRNRRGEIVKFPPKFEGPEWRRAGHKTILYDMEALELFIEHLGNPDRSAYRRDLQELFDNRQQAKRRGRPPATKSPSTTAMA
jgi:hypothetical protein